MPKNVFGKNTTTKQTANTKITDRAGIGTRDNSHRSLMRYIYTNETTARIDCSHAF